MRKTILALLIFLIPLLTSGPAWPQAQPPIRVGVLLSLTGPLAVSGEDTLNGMRLYFDEINNTLAGRKIELTVEDDAGNANMALTKVQKLVEKDKVNLLLGIVSSASAYAIRDYVHNNKIPLMITCAGAADLTLSKKSPYIFRTANDNTQEPMALGYYAATKLGYKTAVAIAADFAAGREMVAAFAKTFTAAGGKMVKEVYPPLGTADFAPFLTQFSKEQGDVMVAMMFGIDGARFLTQYREYGVNKPLVGQGALVSNDVIKASGNAALGVVSAKQYSDIMDTPGVRRFVDESVKRYKGRPDFVAEQGYVGAKAIGEAVKSVGGNVEDTPRFLEALRKVKFQGPVGLVWFDQNQQRVFDVYIRKVERQGNTLVNKVLDRIPEVSQSWTPK